jgi:hypothetical protein
MLYNMTPHVVNILNEDYNVSKTIQPSRRLVRVKEDTRKAGFSVDDICIIEKRYHIDFIVRDEAIGLPDYELGTFYIVSEEVKKALPNRKDLLVPAQTVRNADGTVLGHRSLSI